jgi:hypothetical protein
VLSLLVVQKDYRRMCDREVKCTTGTCMDIIMRAGTQFRTSTNDAGWPVKARSET